jgi:hypothetical protein
MGGRLLWLACGPMGSLARAHQKLSIRGNTMANVRCSGWASSGNAVRRMLDLDHQTKVGTLENTRWQLCKQTAREVRKAA